MAGESPVIVVDVLNGLLEAELSSIFRFVADGSPYVNRASAELRQQLDAMAQASHAHASKLSALIENANGLPVQPAPQGQDQYLAYLSLKFLVPKLAEAKRVMIQRYENAIKALADAPAETTALLEDHLSQHKAHLRILETAVV